jgi:3-hydroxymyristoyl/3-hydroxydecanoyl-(acyl carrier protein) dehydratase
MTSLVDLDETFLPVGPMRQVTRVSSFDGQTIVCEMSIEPHWTYAGHFPGDPIFPGSLIIEAAGQATALWAWLDGQRGKPRMVKAAAEFRAPAGPRDATLTLHVTVKKKRNLNFGAISVRIRDQEIASISNCIAVV